MNKKSLFLIALLMLTLSAWAQVVTTASSITVCTGATSVDIPVKVSSFIKVGSISLKFSYVNSEITSPSVVYKDSGLTTWGTFQASTGTAGTIIISAYDPDVELPTGLTLVDNTILFTLRFTISAITTPAVLSFVENSQGNSCEYGGIGPSYTPFNDTPQPTYYINGSVTVVADPTLDQPANAALCKGGSGTLTTSAQDGTGTFTYKWQYCSTSDGTYTDVASGTPSGITYSNETTPSLTITGDGSESTGDKFYKCILSSAEPSFGSCNATTSAIIVTTADDPSISVHPVSPAAICQGLSLSPLTVTASNGTPSLTYQWYSNTVNTNSGGNSLGSGSGAQTNSYTPPTSTAGTIYYYCVVSASGSGCGDAASNTATVTVNARKKISGTVNYHNLSEDIPLQGEDITVKLYKSSDVTHSNLIGTDVTDNSGYYEITDLCPDCEYDIVATSTHATEGAINTTDAAQANYWGTNPYTIEKVRFHAGDADGPNRYISGIDAGKIQMNFVEGTACDGEAWTFWKAGASILHNPFVEEPEYTEYFPKVNLVVGSDLDADMYGLVTGDFNLSYDPALEKSSSSTLDLIHAGILHMGINQEFYLPVRVVNAISAGAVSLVLNFPLELVEVKDVIINGAGGQFNWAVRGNELRIGWHSAVPIYLSGGSELVTLRLKTSTAFTIGNSIRIALAASPLNELADAKYNVIGNAVLSVDIIDATAVGIGEQAEIGSIALSCYPNPFNNFTMLTYDLPFEGKVRLEINNILGNKVTTLVSKTQAIGTHKVKFDSDGLARGIYTATLRLKSSKDEMIRSIKLINNR